MQELGKETQLYCCKTGCEAAAEYELRSGSRPHEYVHTCLQHIPELMTDAAVHVVIRLTSPVANAGRRKE